MSSRSLRSLVLFSLVLLSCSVFAAPRRRAVRVPAHDCAYSLSYSIPDPVSDTGLVRARVDVTSSNPGQCAGWAAISNVEWITVETSEGASFVTVLPNLTNQPRTGQVRIGGTLINITQVAAAEPPDNNLVRNGKFNVDLSNWGWPSRFPNGTGDATWTTLDANNSMTSGSMRLRDDFTSGPAYQQLQCFNVESGSYAHGFAARVANPSAAEPVMALVQFRDLDCNGEYAYGLATTQVTRANVWQRFSLVTFVASDVKSVGLIIAAYARAPGVHEVWIDDVFLRRQ